MHGGSVFEFVHDNLFLFHTIIVDCQDCSPSVHKLDRNTLVALCLAALEELFQLGVPIQGSATAGDNLSRQSPPGNRGQGGQQQAQCKTIRPMVHLVGEFYLVPGWSYGMLTKAVDIIWVLARSGCFSLTVNAACRAPARVVNFRVIIIISKEAQCRRERELFVMSAVKQSKSQQKWI